jgi:hypothetical protein
VAPGSSVLDAPRAADPDAGALPWTVRVSRSGTGLTCSTVGQVRGAEFGLVGLDGVFRAIPEANADACGEPGTLLGARVFAARRTRDVRTVVNGVAGDDVAKVTLTLAGRPPRVLEHSPAGAFAFVIRGYPEDVAPVVTLERRGGAIRRYAFGGGMTIPDPRGGHAWTVTTSGGGFKREDRTRIACVAFQRARAGGDRSPWVCGRESNRREVKLFPLFYRTAVVHGRVAIWGSIRARGDIEIRAGGFSETVDKGRAGAFLVFLPQGTDPKRVTVVIKGRRYGPTFGAVAKPRGVR